MTERMKFAPASGYIVTDDTEIVRLRDLNATHRARVIEIRNAVTRAGRAGYLVDANHYLFDETVAIRYEDEQEGLFASPDDVVLVHPAGRTLEEVAALYDTGEAEP